MLGLIEHLPDDLVGVNVLGYLAVRDIVMLERASGSKKSHQIFLNIIPHSPPVILPPCKHQTISTLEWFEKRSCAIRSLNIQLPSDNPVLHMESLKVDNFNLQIFPQTTIENCKQFLESNIGVKVRSVAIKNDPSREVMEQLSVCTSNIKQMLIIAADHCMDWLTVDILTRWKIKVVELNKIFSITPLVKRIVQTCSELISIGLYCEDINDFAVIAIAQHCPKVEKLTINEYYISTYNSLVALSERGLPLPNIPTVDVARRCSHALSCIRHLSTYNLHAKRQDASILLPYMTGLHRINLSCHCLSYLPLLLQHCNKLTEIGVYDKAFPVEHILSMCRVNPLLQELYNYIHSSSHMSLILLILAY